MLHCSVAVAMSLLSLGAVKVSESSRQDVYARLNKIRHELAELRLHCGRAEAEKLGPLRERCKKQAKEISYLEHRYQNAQDEIRHLRSLLCKNQGIILNCTGDADQVDHSSLPCNSPSCIQDKEWLLEKLRSSEWQVCRMEKYVDELNVALTRRVLELNELQLFCSQQAKELMEISRKNFESSRNSSNQASRNSEMSFSVERTSAPCDLRVTPPITRIVQED